MTITQVCENYHALVYRYARQYTHDADDLVQDVFLKACRYWTHEQEAWTSEQVKAWLYQIMRNTSIDRARKARLHAMRFQELTDIHCAPTTIESDVERREQMTVALSHLTAKQRSTLLLAAQGYTRKEMAMSGEKAHAIVSQLCRAKKAFLEQWELAA